MTPFPYLDEHTSFTFPPLEQATEEGIVAAGGNLSPGMLLSAYQQGIFPWYSEGEPILWWNPDPRMVLPLENLHISKSMRKILQKDHFTYSVDEAFEEVMRNCGSIRRPGQDSTWITEEMVEGYTYLHKLGYAHSVEVWQEDLLVGGLYGISLGSLFFGESMFSKVSNASKAGYIRLVKALGKLDFSLVDCQVYTPHLASLGAFEISRDEYMVLLKKGLEKDTLKGDWNVLGGID